MLNLLVETKNEYTAQLINILKLLIFDGLRGIYKEALELNKNDLNSKNILRQFQELLKDIPSWDKDKVNEVTNYIMNSTHSTGFLQKLLKATIKANIVILMYNPMNITQKPIDPKYYNSILLSTFIHKVYIECAREFYNNPYLLYHNYQPIDIKRNQRDSLNIIKDCIKESIRKLLPLNHVLESYLADDVMKENDNIEQHVTEVEKRNLEKVIEKDLNNNNMKEDNIMEDNIIKENNNNMDEEVKLNGGRFDEIIKEKEKENDIIDKSNSDEKTLGSKILDILENDDATSENFQIDDEKINMKEINLKDKENELLKKENELLKKEKKINNDIDLETSINYEMEDNFNYHEIFTN